MLYVWRLYQYTEVRGGDAICVEAVSTHGGKRWRCYTCGGSISTQVRGGDAIRVEALSTHRGKRWRCYMCGGSINTQR
jgi:PHP family Zn ribbon phosphoesterase